MRDVANFVGMSISILICVALMTVLLTSFKGRQLYRKMKISTAVVFITIIIYDLCSMLRKSFIPGHYCVIREPLGLPPFLISRASLYYFFIIRMELTFTGSGVEFSRTLVKGLKITTITIYGSFALYFIVTAYRQVYDPVDDDCDSNMPLFVYITVMAIYALIDFLLGLIICSLYLYRLYALYKLVKITGAVANDSTERNKMLLHVIKKQGKLAYIAYISTLFLITIAPPTTGLTAAYIDSIVNGLCVYCTFNWNENVYQYLCNCNGNKCLLCLFCTLCGCCCCNEAQGVELKVNGSKNNERNEENGCSQTSENEINSSSKSSNVTTNPIEMVLH